MLIKYIVKKKKKKKKVIPTSNSQNLSDINARINKHVLGSWTFDFTFSLLWGHMVMVQLGNCPALYTVLNRGVGYHIALISNPLGVPLKTSKEYIKLNYMQVL